MARHGWRLLFLVYTCIAAARVTTCEQDTDYNRGVPIAERRASPGKVAYGIMVYQRKGKTAANVMEQFQRLWDAVYTPDFTFTVHLDSKSSEELLTAMRAYLEPFPNAYQIPSVSVSWAGITVVERTIALMQAALEADPEWEYFVNIGQEDYPMASPETIQATLASHPEGTNFIKCWDIHGHDFFGQWEHHSKRVTKVFVDSFEGRASDLNAFRAPTKEFRFYKSLQQTVLSREVTEHAVYSAESRRLLIYLANSQAPDEIFFPTLVRSQPQFASRSTCDNTLHLSHWIRPGGSWHPEYLTPIHLPLILETLKQGRGLWMRKVDVVKGARSLLDAMDVLRTCPEDTSIDNMDWVVPVLFAKHDMVNMTLSSTQSHPAEGLYAGRGKPDLCEVTRRKVWQQGFVVTGEELMGQLDKARRQHDADKIMAFVLERDGMGMGVRGQGTSQQHKAQSQAQRVQTPQASGWKIGPDGVPYQPQSAHSRAGSASEGVNDWPANHEGGRMAAAQQIQTS